MCVALARSEGIVVNLIFFRLFSEPYITGCVPANSHYWPEEAVKKLCSAHEYIATV